METSPSTLTRGDRNTHLLSSVCQDHLIVHRVISNDSLGLSVHQVVDAWTWPPCGAGQPLPNLPVLMVKGVPWQTQGAVEVGYFVLSFHQNVREDLS